MQSARELALQHSPQLTSQLARLEEGHEHSWHILQQAGARHEPLVLNWRTSPACCVIDLKRTLQQGLVHGGLGWGLSVSELVMKCGHLSRPGLIIGHAAQPLLGLSFPNLKRLELHGCHFTSPDLLRATGKSSVESLLQRLTHISLLHCSCSSEEVTEQLSQALGQLPGLCSVHVTSTGISSGVLQACGSRITTLTYQHTGPRHMSDDWDQLAAGISCTPNLLSLTLSTDKGAHAASSAQLQQLAQACPQLQTLSLPCSTINQAGLDVLLAMQQLQQVELGAIKPLQASRAHAPCRWQRLVVREPVYAPCITLLPLAAIPSISLPGLALADLHAIEADPSSWLFRLSSGGVGSLSSAEALREAVHCLLAHPGLRPTQPGQLHVHSAACSSQRASPFKLPLSGVGPLLAEMRPLMVRLGTQRLVLDGLVLAGDEVAALGCADARLSHLDVRECAILPDFWEKLLTAMPHVARVHVAKRARGDHMARLQHLCVTATRSVTLVFGPRALSAEEAAQLGAACGPSIHREQVVVMTEEPLVVPAGRQGLGAASHPGCTHAVAQVHTAIHVRPAAVA
eukprot:CAMPEP_0202868926 /NCGR_PEP_ID=MMETSP1391-20130828/11394_1 /ASSEMBLY_ACC=CAM_ASM_000867 /TAXON_ID=1034604 /ORGANISM="Chlamydomonas leiostraca, Strain SAG 11-49" /LENGTH=570 /DNA_ID=CAMNT_0049549155 /DNA_START=270 /DNA_END=1983 /DNA_ORIENTATION=+